MNNKKFIFPLLFAFATAILLLVGSCKEQIIEKYSSVDYLYFERMMKNSQGVETRVDTVALSFSQYGTANTLVIPFTIKLIGNVLGEDKEYKVRVVTEATTARVGQYTLPEKLIFKKGVTTDSLNVTIHREALAEDEEVVLMLALEENSNFRVGYYTYDVVKLRFNNRIVQPLWWTYDPVSTVYFGDYSYEKLQTIVLANPGFTTIVGISWTEVRKIAKITKKYIEENNITEKDGSPMILPII